MALHALNPTTGEEIERFEEFTWKQVDARLATTSKAFKDWRLTNFSERANRMRALSELLRRNKREYGRIMALEMGKPITEAIAESEKCAWACNFYAEKAESLLADEEVPTEAKRSFVRYEPLGPVLAVMPWNFPFWQVFRFAAPGLMAGNAGILKHASNVPGCAVAIEDVFRKADFSANIFRTLLIGSKHVEAVIENRLVMAATLTGSTPAGKSVARKCGDMLKKTVLELGGSDAYVVLEDADVEAAVNTCVTSRLINSGQSCIAAKRFVVVKSIRNRFEELFV